MKRTREEQVEFLNEHYKFPCRIIFQLAKHEGEYKIVTQEYYNKKKNLENIRFNEVKTFTIGGAVMTPLGVGEVLNAEDLIDITDRYREVWI